MIYVHTERLSLALAALGRKAGRWVLALNPTAEECHNFSVIDGEVIGRAEGPWDGHGWMQISPAEYANALGSRLPMVSLWGVTLPNEPNDGDPAWMAAAVREIRQRWPHLYVLVGCWANGHDGFVVPVADEDLPYIIYNFHGYGRPDKPEMVLYSAPYLALRYRDTMRGVRAVQPNALAFIGEFGCTMAAPDFEDNGRCGEDVSLLDSDGFDFDRYWQSILAFIEEIRKDGYVLGAMLFEFGAFPKWQTMEHIGTPIEARVREYVRPRPETQPAQPQTPSITVPWEETPMPLTQGALPPSGPEFDTWWNAGGWKNFASWPGSPGFAQRTTDERRAFVLDRIESATKETSEFLLSLPLV